MPARDRLQTTGVWVGLDGQPASEAIESVQRIAALGYSTVWFPETVGRDPFALIGNLAAQTSELVFATGIANIWNRHPGVMKQAAMALHELTGGRFVLGIGVSHAPLVEGLRKIEYTKPLSQMKTYLEAMAASPYGGPKPADGSQPLTVLAALGPKMLALSAQETDGAHPYWTTPEHTAQAREIMGPDALLCVEQKVVLSTDASAARAAGAEQLAYYKSLPNYRNNWKRLGFTEDQIENDEPAFVDAVVAWGDADAIGNRVKAHYDAGATHVCIQPVSTAGFGKVDWNALEALAPS